MSHNLSDKRCWRLTASSKFVGGDLRVDACTYVYDGYKTPVLSAKHVMIHCSVKSSNKWVKVNIILYANSYFKFNFKTIEVIYQ